MAVTLPYMPRRVNVLVVSPLLQTRTQLRSVFQHTNWSLEEVHTCRDALIALNGSRIPVIICEAVLPDGTWRDLLESATVLSQRSALLVTSAWADEVLWTEVLTCGAYDLLVRPFDVREVVRILSQAYLQATSPYATRAAAPAVSLARA